MKTLVIHMADASTDFLKPIYAGQSWTILRSGAQLTAGAVHGAMSSHDRVVMLGHGSPTGLFGAGTFSVCSRSVPFLRGKPNIYIWCHADQFVEKHNLSGFYTGMFISEVTEANFFHVPATQEEVDASNEDFVKIVARHASGSSEEIFRAVLRGYFAGRLVADYNRNLVNFK